MLQTKGNAPRFTVAITALFILCSGCGGGSSTPGPNTESLSPTQAQAVTDQVVQALTQSLDNTFSASLAGADVARPNLSGAVSRIHPDSSGGCTSTSTGENCNWPISLLNFPCSGINGGTISVTGDIDGSLNNLGEGR